MNARMTGLDQKSHQKVLAEALIRCLGHDGAARACRENCWHGVLDLVLVRQDLIRGRCVL